MSKGFDNFKRLVKTWFQNETGFAASNVSSSAGCIDIEFTDDQGDSYRVSIDSAEVLEGVYSDPLLEDFINEEFADSLAALHGCDGFSKDLEEATKLNELLDEYTGPVVEDDLEDDPEFNEDLKFVTDYFFATGDIECLKGDLETLIQKYS